MEFKLKELVEPIGIEQIAINGGNARFIAFYFFELPPKLPPFTFEDNFVIFYYLGGTVDPSVDPLANLAFYAIKL